MIQIFMVVVNEVLKRCKRHYAEVLRIAEKGN